MRASMFLPIIFGLVPAGLVAYFASKHFYPASTTEIIIIIAAAILAFWLGIFIMNKVRKTTKTQSYGLLAFGDNRDKVEETIRNVFKILFVAVPLLSVSWINTDVLTSLEAFVFAAIEAYFLLVGFLGNIKQNTLSAKSTSTTSKLFDVMTLN